MQWILRNIDRSVSTTTTIKIKNLCLNPKISSCTFVVKFLPKFPTHKQPLSFFCPISLPFPERLINVIVQYVAYWVWFFFPFIIMHLRFIHVVANSLILFYWWVIFHCMDVPPHFVNRITTWWTFEIFPACSNMSTATINICGCVFVWIYVFTYQA